MASIPASYTLAVLFLISVFFSCHGFSLKGFCATNCARGKGGNLCKCNGFHFAGKRVLPSLKSDAYSDSTSDTKGENFLELNSNGLGVFGYPKDEARTTRNTNSPGKFRALLEKYLTERYTRGNGFGSNTGSQSWQGFNTGE